MEVHRESGRAQATGLMLAVVLFVAATIWTAFEMLRHSNEPATQAGDGEIDWKEPVEGMSLAQSSGKPILFDFTAEWCPPCRMMEAQVFADSEVADVVNSKFVPVRVLDRQREEGANPQPVDELQAKYRIDSFPTLLVASPAGREYLRAIGYRSKRRTREFLSESLAMMREAPVNETPEAGAPGR